MSLEIEFHESLHSLDLSCFLVEFDYDYVVAYSSLETPTQFSRESILRLHSSSVQLEWILH